MSGGQSGAILTRGQAVIRAVGATLAMTIVTLVALEVVLRVADFRELREEASERSLAYRYDAELGWEPVPNSTSVVTTARTIHAQHNSLGLRDVEFVRDATPTILFIGDSFVWGVDAEAPERFTDLIRSRISGYKVLNAGVSGYGTDQEYLFLQRLWPKVKPAVVVLVFCTDNDRKDNVTNIRYGGYQKPYFVTEPNGELVLKGQPVPKSRQLYIRENWLVRHLWLARVATAAYVELRYPRLDVPDPTEALVGKIRNFVRANGAEFLVGIQSSDIRLIDYLRGEKIPFVTFDGAEAYSDRYGSHWTPEGHKLVAARLMGLLNEKRVE